MPQEATMIAVDNSDFMRNGDFNPTRLQCQSDAVSLICQTKHRNNVENTMGLISLANNEVICTLTSDLSKLYSRLHFVEPKGSVNFCTALKIAHLALRHRQMRTQKMRIVCFIGSPVEDKEESMIQLAKRLKKENVSVDLINFGENEMNQQKLSKFIEVLDGETSHLVSVPPGAVLSESLRTSPIMADEFGGAVGGSGMGLDFGLDGSEDPDLLFALRVSMEDQRMRQEQELAASRNTDANATALPVASGTLEDEMLQQALRMSMQTGGAEDTSVPRPMDVDFTEMSEEDQIAYVTAMSLQQGGSDGAKQTETTMDTSATAMEVEKPTDTTSGVAASDLDVIRNVLEGLPAEETPEDTGEKKDKSKK